MMFEIGEKVAESGASRVQSRLVLGCAIGLSLILISTILAPVIAPYSYDAIDLPARLQLPSARHWLGTDELGRDIFTRLLYGGRVSFFISFVVVLLSMFLGVTVGLIGGYRGGWLDEVIMRLADVLLSFPGILLAIALMAILGPSLQNVVIALVTIGWVLYARLTRSLTLKLRELDFIRASLNLGAKPSRILFHHILPNILPSMIVQGSFSFAGMILAESSLSFLGLGVQPPYPSWGTMLNEGKNHLLDAPYLMMFPGFAIFISVLMFNLLGDALRDRLDPRLRV
ncbi:MAG TPA: nickel transporter permease [Acidobacteriota bacterium]|nr:nickel transporter permease [Acidobacteriota bacterium]